jgi:hypothetical protein
MRKALIIAVLGGVFVVGGTAAATVGATSNDRLQPAVTPSVGAAASTVPSTSEAEARRIAGEAVPGAQVTEIEQLSVSGRPAWKVHLSTATGRHEVLVAAANGQVLGVERSGGDSPQVSPSVRTTGTEFAPADPRWGVDDGRDTSRKGTDDGPNHDVGDDHGGRSRA